MTFIHPHVGKQTVVKSNGLYQVNTYTGSERGWMISTSIPANHVETKKKEQLKYLINRIPALKRGVEEILSRECESTGELLSDAIESRGVAAAILVIRTFAKNNVTSGL